MTETYWDNDLQRELPEDRGARYALLRALWQKRLTPEELRALREAYGEYEYGIARAEAQALKEALWLMEYEDRQALRRWCRAVNGVRS